MFGEPFVVIFNALMVSIIILCVAVVFLAFHHQLDCAVNYLRLRKHPLPNVFSAVWALFLSDQTLIDALFTKRVTANGRPAAHDVVHADRAIQLIDIFK